MHVTLSARSSRYHAGVENVDTPMKFITSLLVPLLSVALLLPGSIQARVIGTDAAILDGQRVERIDRIHAALARDDVQRTMVALGVDAADAAQRVGALSDAELIALEGKLHELPAGSTGVIAVVGIVAIVLIILELVGVTNIFTNF
jgi:hypothetical protein